MHAALTQKLRTAREPRSRGGTAIVASSVAKTDRCVSCGRMPKAACMSLQQHKHAQHGQFSWSQGGGPLLSWELGRGP
jgi:hypothetical protein